MKFNRRFKFLALSCSMLLLQSIAVIPTANADGQGSLIKLAALGATNTMSTPLFSQKERPLMVAEDWHQCVDMCNAQENLCKSQCGSGNYNCESACKEVRKACRDKCMFP